MTDATSAPTRSTISDDDDLRAVWRVWFDRRRDIIEIIYRLNPHLKPSDIEMVREQCEWLTTIPVENFDFALRDAVAKDEQWRKDTLLEVMEVMEVLE